MRQHSSLMAHCCPKSQRVASEVGRWLLEPVFDAGELGEPAGARRPCPDGTASGADISGRAVSRTPPPNGYLVENPP